MTTHTNSDNYIELQDLWKTSYPALSFDNSAHSTTYTTAITSRNSPSLRHRPTPLPDLTATLKSPILPYYPTSPLPSLESPFLPPRSAQKSKSRHFKSTKQKTCAILHRVTNNLHVQIQSKPHLARLRKMMNAHSQRVEKKEEAKRLAKEEFHRNWDAMTEEEQATYTKEREEARLRERKRLEDVKNGNDETRKADAKTAAFAGSIVVCMWNTGVAFNNYTPVRCGINGCDGWSLRKGDWRLYFEIWSWRLGACVKRDTHEQRWRVMAPLLILSWWVWFGSWWVGLFKLGLTISLVQVLVFQ